MRANEEFLSVITKSFDAFLNKGTSRSTDKLKPLHGAIARDIAGRLGDSYDVWSQGYLSDKEVSIQGRYVNKKVDITVVEKQSGMAVAGIAVKFVMQNYSQNSNNYFENMLGETANIRSAGCPYFQIFIILDRLPYYNNEKYITRWETFTDHNVAKYVALSRDNVLTSLHTPDKTLIYVVHLPDAPEGNLHISDYLEFYRAIPHDLTLTSHAYPKFGPNVILNDYERFIDSVIDTIKP
ncbi:MAG: hypothetical protein K2H87_02885 [Duncaniella sp.]|nr:hypothetical protein [Duncaniella sp.]